MIAEKIRSLREKHGYTQSELAKLLSITRSGVNAWEMGISVPSTQYIVDLASIFRVSSDYLLGIEATATINVDGLTAEDVELLSSLADHLRKKNHSSEQFP